MRKEYMDETGFRGPKICLTTNAHVLFLLAFRLDKLILDLQYNLHVRILNVQFNLAPRTWLQNQVLQVFYLWIFVIGYLIIILPTQVLLYYSSIVVWVVQQYILLIFVQSLSIYSMRLSRKLKPVARKVNLGLQSAARRQYGHILLLKTRTFGHREPLEYPITQPGLKTSKFRLEEDDEYVFIAEPNLLKKKFISLRAYILDHKTHKRVNTMYKTVDKKVKPVSMCMPPESKVRRQIPEDPIKTLQLLPRVSPKFMPTQKLTLERLAKLIRMAFYQNKNSSSSSM